MRVITKLADRLLGRVAPKATAEAVCTAPAECTCVDGRMLCVSGCPPYSTWDAGSC